MTFPRRCVFAGTTNDTEYLPDPTGNRRFWPVPCNCVDLDAILRDRDQLWAEAVMRFEQHEPWHVDDPEFDALCVQEQLERYTSDPWEIIVAEWLSKRTNDPKGVIMGDALFGALGVETAKQTKREQMRLAAAMAACGWAKGRQRRRNGIAVRPWYVAGSHYLACDPPGGSEVAT